MKKKRMVLSCLALAMLTVFSTAGCTAKTPAPSAAPQTHVVNDIYGQVELPQECERIAVTAPAYMTGVLMAGAKDKLVALEDAYGRNEWLLEKMPQLADVPVVFANNEIDMETLLAQKPDLVIYAGRYGDDARKQLNDAGIACVAGSADDAEKTALEGIRDTQLYYGEVIGGASAQKAEAYGKYFDSVFDSISKRTASLTEQQRKRVIQVRTYDPLVVINAKGIGHEWMTLAGGTNMAQDLEGNGNVETTLEEVLAWDPEYIICDTKQAKDSILADKAWKNVSAVKNGNVIIMPTGVMAWGYYGPEEALMMQFAAKWLQPELFEDIDMDTAVKAFYDEYFGFEITQKDLDRIFHKGE